jgi:acetoin:2,6-dichlorophenolindophenol oxidoreductase subunit alpha
MKMVLPETPSARELTAYPLELLVDMYRRMYLIREFENRANELFLRGLMPGTIHLSHGQEATPVGTCLALRDDDLVTLTHRGHGQALAKGVPPRSLMAELFGKETGCCGGRGGSLHVGDYAFGALPAIAVVGASAPIAAGLAFACKRRGSGRVVCNFFGEGAANKGELHEAMNLAAIWALPVIFVCENNLYAVSTHLSDAMLNDFVSERAAAYRMPGVTVGGNDPIEVYEAVAEAVTRARGGGGPTLVECLTYRHGGHKRDDAATYRPVEEVEAWLARDPLPSFRERLIGDGRVGDGEVATLEGEIQDLVTDAVEFAQSSDFPPAESAFENVYA